MLVASNDISFAQDPTLGELLNSPYDRALKYFDSSDNAIGKKTTLTSCQDPESDICVKPGYNKYLRPTGFYLVPTIMRIHVCIINYSIKPPAN